MKIQRALLSIFIFGIIFLIPQSVRASTLVINNIVVNNFLPEAVPLYSADETYSVNTTGTFSIDFSPDIKKFQIIVLQNPYDENRALAEKTFVEKLGITKSEACFMNVSIVAPAYVTDIPDSNKLLLCEPDKQADINSDGVINTFDYAICLEEMVVDPEKNKLQCDLNVNRRIDATDLSKLITHARKRQ